MDWNSGTILWFLLTIGFIVIEIMIPALVSVWFAIAALILTIISGFISNTLYEFYIFVALSGVLLALTRPVVKKLLEKRKPIEDRIIHQEVTIIEKIEEHLYEVKLDGKFWKATSKEKMDVGEVGVVEKIEGNKLILVRKK